jgi:hypothetical protein
VGYGLYPGDDSAGASSNGGGDNVDGGESVGLVRKLPSGNVETCFGRSIVYVPARPVSCADGSQGP